MHWFQFSFYKKIITINNYVNEKSPNIKEMSLFLLFTLNILCFLFLNLISQQQRIERKTREHFFVLGFTVCTAGCSVVTGTVLLGWTYEATRPQGPQHSWRIYQINLLSEPNELDLSTCTIYCFLFNLFIYILKFNF
jgi:hypothetical protein